MLDNKIILVTGGTGTIGESFIKSLLKNHSPNVIRIYSRDETKQYLLEKKLSQYAGKIRFFIGDIRDKDRLDRAMNNVDMVFHFAALKHVVACEYNPFEAIKTNIIGLQNLLELSIDHNIEKFVFTSSDKAATPSNTMGVTKLLGEKLVTAANYYKGYSKTIFYSVRFGNVLGSRGSIIPLIRKQIKNDQPINLTHSEMTRYIMDIDTALKLIFDTLDLAQGGEIFVFKMNMIKIVDLIDILIEHFAKKYSKNIENIHIKETGLVSGEKLYEELFSIEESEKTYEMNNMFVIFPQISELSRAINYNNYPNLKKFDPNTPFNSKEGPFMNEEALKKFLISHNII